MNANQDMEKIYEFLEKSDFRELSEPDRNYVLLSMSEEEYNNLRSTVKDTEMLFSNSRDSEPDKSIYTSLNGMKENKNRILGVMRYPVQFYKVAATVIVLMGLFSFIHFSNLHEQNNESLSNDTIFVYKTDTVSSRIVDTLLR
jgi:hypothetical protein